jgi:glutamate/tyrosine decarboxylase-like PLP-dependent enzyme
MSVAGSQLFPDVSQRKWWDDRLTQLLWAAHERVGQGPVTPSVDMELFRQELRRFDFERPAEFQELLAWTIEKLERGVVHLTHPRYFGLFNPAPSFPAQCADRIANLFNPQLTTSRTSPVPVEIEAHVIASFARRVGLPDGSAGHFTTGGSEANYTALISALTRADAKFAEQGARCFEGQPSIFVSAEAHHSWIKIAHQAGIGRSAVRIVPTDGKGRMDPAALAEHVTADLARGGTPVMVVATAGTTSAGMVDPLFDCARVARNHGIWYHIDAAWGGSVVASERSRHLVAGIAEADSITIDAHKWLATTMGCGMYLTRHPEILTAAFQVSTGYMPSANVQIDPYLTSVQWSRRFLGLRLFLALAAVGWAGYAEHVERSLRLSHSLQQQMVERGWSIANEPSLAVLCLVPPQGGADARAVVDRVLRSGRAWVSLAVFEGREVVRACVTHGETSSDDVRQLVSALQEAGRG